MLKDVAQGVLFGKTARLVSVPVETLPSSMHVAHARCPRDRLAHRARLLSLGAKKKRWKRSRFEGQGETPWLKLPYTRYPGRSSTASRSARTCCPERALSYFVCTSCEVPDGYWSTHTRCSAGTGTQCTGPRPSHPHLPGDFGRGLDRVAGSTPRSAAPVSAS